VVIRAGVKWSPFGDDCGRYRKNKKLIGHVNNYQLIEEDTVPYNTFIM
jgi:hypothetical protein